MYVIELKGRIDSTNAMEEEKRIMDLIEKNPDESISFDASGLSYISSAGLRVLMKVKKQIKADLQITDVSPEVYDIFETTGFTQLFNVRKKYREISVDGCKVIGKGAYGTVYRLDEDTVVKKYDSAEALSMIENEKKLARLAFVAGIPTAISFDIVKIGDTYGSVFEMLKAKTFNDLIKENPANADDIIKQYADLIKQVHSTKLPAGTLPSSRQKYIEKLKNIKHMIPEELYGKTEVFLNSIPEDDHLIHGDLQMKNIMLSDNEPMLIDMDTLSQGIPLFDIAGIYVAYIVFEEDEPGNNMKFFGIATETGKKIWDGVCKNCLREEDFDKMQILAYVLFLDMFKNSSPDDELSATRIRHSIKHLEELLR
ncbi:MAG: phosphotransferase [Lachnospiraceae bacterium]|nr:phosphotransferase [Lachnospiraceae bacterium]